METEMVRLKIMYSRLPPDKKKQSGHILERISELEDEIEGAGNPILMWILLFFVGGAMAVAVGFFSVTFLAKKRQSAVEFPPSIEQSFKNS